MRLARETSIGEFADHFRTLELLRRPLLQDPDGHTRTQQASAQFVALDGLVRDVLRDAISFLWTDPDVSALGRDLGLPALAKHTRTLAPPGIDADLVDRLELDFHRRRNDIEHERRLVSSAEALAFAESIESLLYAITQPEVPELPPADFGSSADAELVGRHFFTRGLNGGTWLANHMRQGAHLQTRHYVELWEHAADE